MYEHLTISKCTFGVVKLEPLMLLLYECILFEKVNFYLMLIFNGICYLCDKNIKLTFYWHDCYKVMIASNIKNWRTNYL